MRNIATFAVILFVISAPACFIAWATSEGATADYELWDAQCPWGRYYSDVEGGFLFISTSLGEGYVLKYLDGPELKTLIVDSQDSDVHVFLQDDPSRAWMTVIYGHLGGILEVYIYVPDPKAMVEEV